jgi:hypothetical protein
LAAEHRISCRIAPIHVFVYTPREEKIRPVRISGKSEVEAIELVSAIHQERATFIRKYFGKEWPTRHLYHPMINSKVSDDAIIRTILDEVATVHLVPAAQNY